MVARHSRGVPGAGKTGVTEKRAGPGGSVHIKYVDQTAPVFRLRRSRVVQQPGGELNASDSGGPQELAARRQPSSRSESRGDSLRRGILPQAANACEGLSRRGT